MSLSLKRASKHLQERLVCSLSSFESGILVPYFVLYEGCQWVTCRTLVITVLSVLKPNSVSSFFLTNRALSLLSQCKKFHWEWYIACMSKLLGTYFGQAVELGFRGYSSCNQGYTGRKVKPPSNRNIKMD